MTRLSRSTTESTGSQTSSLVRCGASRWRICSSNRPQPIDRPRFSSVVSGSWRGPGTALDHRHPIMGIVDFPARQEHTALDAYHRALGFPSPDADSTAELLRQCAVGSGVVGEPLILLAAVELDH